MSRLLTELTAAVLEAWGLDPAAASQEDREAARRAVLAVNVLARYDDAGRMDLGAEDAE